MNTEIYFIYDSHCPWSFATTQLVNSIHKAYPEMPIHLLHTVYYGGSDGVSKKQLDQVQELSNVRFGKDYLRFADAPKDATMTANFVTWLENKNPTVALDVLNALQKEHFIDGNPLHERDDFDDVLKQFKLSPPVKIFKDKLSKDVELNLGGIAELQDVIRTAAFPALLLAKDDNLVLLNHNLYLLEPDAISDAIALELKG